MKRLRPVGGTRRPTLVSLMYRLAMPWLDGGGSIPMHLLRKTAIRKISIRTTSCALALLVGSSLLTSCASVSKDPVNCGVIGSVVGAVAGGALGAAFGSSGNVTGGAILGTTLGAGLGAISGYQICKHPTFDTADEKARKHRIETSPAEKETPAAEEPAEAPGDEAPAEN